MSSLTLKKFRSFLTPEVKDRLDAYVEEKIGTGGEGIAILSYKKNMLEPLFPGLSRPMIAVALSAYADLARERWHVEYHRTSNNPYYIMAYKDGQKRDKPTRIHGADLDLIKAYLDDVLTKGRIVLASDKLLEEAGYALRTEYRQHWLLMNTFFGLNPEYLVLGINTRYDHKNLRYEMTFMVTDDPGRSSLNEESIAGIFMYLSRGKIPISGDSEHISRPRYTSAGDISRTIPAEAEVLGQMRGQPVTVKELAKQISSSETLVRLAIKRLYLRGFVTVIGRRDGPVGRSSYLYQLAGKAEEMADMAQS